MNRDPEITKLFQLLEEKNSFSICLPANPSLDALMSGTAIYTMLADLGKQVTLACSSSVAASGQYFGVEKVTSQLISDGNSLLISVPYKNGGIDSVNYYVENDRLFVSVTPDATTERVRPEDVQFTYTSGAVDVFIVLDSPRLDVLGELYAQNKSKFETSRIVNIDRRFNNALYGAINIIEKDAASLSEMITRILKGFNRQPTKEIATNLYAGILQATNNFAAYSVSADTLEAAAYLLKHNAQKRVPAPAAAASTSNVAGANVNRATTTELPAAAPTIQVPQVEIPQPVVQVQPPVEVQPAVVSEIPTVVPSQVEQPIAVAQEKQAPTDWLRPKIFGGQRTAQ